MDIGQLCGEGSYTYEHLVRDISILERTYPFVDVMTIGRSVEGRNLFAIGLGVGPKRIHFTAGMHANEWLTTPLLMKFCFDYCHSLQNRQPAAGIDVVAAYQRCTVWLTPAMNPDGAQLVQQGIRRDNPFYQDVINFNRGSTNFRGWKSNIRGVDLNHQFPACWPAQAKASPQHPAPRDYAGPEPLSEPEARALADFTKEWDFARVLAFHSQGEIIYWGYQGLEPAESAKLAQALSRLSGYRTVRYAGTHAGYKDWFIQDWRRPGFTVEIGRGTNPLPTHDLPAIYAKLNHMLFGILQL